MHEGEQGSVMSVMAVLHALEVTVSLSLSLSHSFGWRGKQSDGEADVGSDEGCGQVEGWLVVGIVDLQLPRRNGISQTSEAVP
jgi:hypothetical protein